MYWLVEMVVTSNAFLGPFHQSPGVTQDMAGNPQCPHRNPTEECMWIRGTEDPAFSAAQPSESFVTPSQAPTLPEHKCSKSTVKALRHWHKTHSSVL